MAVRLLAVAAGAAVASVGAIPSNPHYFEQQLVDHTSTDGLTFSQRYYSSTSHFKGPGHPVFVIIGGEGAVPPSTGLFYPFVVDVLAAQFGGMVVQPEHRFYGESLPFGNASYGDDQLHLLNPEQVLPACQPHLVAVAAPLLAALHPNYPAVSPLRPTRIQSDPGPVFGDRRLPTPHDSRSR